MVSVLFSPPRLTLLPRPAFHPELWLIPWPSFWTLLYPSVPAQHGCRRSAGAGRRSAGAGRSTGKPCRPRIRAALVLLAIDRNLKGRRRAPVPFARTSGLGPILFPAPKA